MDGFGTLSTTTSGEKRGGRFTTVTVVPAIFSLSLDSLSSSWLHREGEGALRRGEGEWGNVGEAGAELGYSKCRQIGVGATEQARLEAAP